jgi:hypothetical protein
MATLADVFRELNSLKTTGVVRDDAIGGATAVLFYAEPARTYDVDVFLLLEATPVSSLVSLIAKQRPFQSWERPWPIEP